jgi:hypothetical protein
MARDEKPVRLRPIDEEAEKAEPVIRLANAETAQRGSDETPIRLQSSDSEAGEEQRLELPDRDEVELRTFQPTVEALIEAETYNPESLEQSWDESAARRNPIPWGWFVLMATIIASAAIWSLTRVEKSKETIGQIEIAAKSALEKEKQEDLAATLQVDKINNAMREFFAATDIELLTRHARQPDRVGPLMRSYYANKKVFSGNLRTVNSLQPLTIGNSGNYWKANVLLSDGKTKNLIIEMPASGEPKIDWETLVCYQPMEWNDFVSQRPQGTSMDFRVMIEKDSFYSHEFADSQKWMSFRLTAMGSEETLFGYAPTEGELAKSLVDFIRKNGDKKVSVILRLSIPGHIQSRRGVVIEKFLSPRWIYLTPPDSGS